MHGYYSQVCEQYTTSVYKYDKCVKSKTRYVSLLQPSVGALGYVLCVNITTKYVLSLCV